jgi:hypothetical protein
MPQTVLLIVISMTCVSLPVNVLFAAVQLPMYMKLLPMGWGIGGYVKKNAYFPTKKIFPKLCQCKFV